MANITNTPLSTYGADLTANPMDQVETLLNAGPSTNQINQQTIDAISQNQKNVMSTTPSILKGVATEQGFLTPKSTNQFGSALGGSQGDIAQAVSGAIGQRNLRRSDDFVGSLSRDIALNAPVRESARLNQSIQNMSGVAANKINNLNIMNQYNLDKNRLELYKQTQSNSLIAGILGVIGTVGGVVAGSFAGNPAAGAAVGGSVGNAAGKAVTK